MVCRHTAFGSDPVIAGIIEMGDEAPFCSWRDSLLTLDLGSFSEWLEGQANPRESAANAASRLRAFRQTLLPSRVAKNLARQEAALVVKRVSELEERAAGRSTTGDEFMARKRIAYGVRLARGEVAMERLARGLPLEGAAEQSDLTAGVRAVHDLLIPRVHMEASVCGAVPPFSYGLAGKLVISFLAHPAILGLPATARGSVLEQSFNLEELVPLLPKHGMLALTTKGLYAKHSPMYNRSEVPGSKGSIRLEHVANTEGTTTTFFGNRTARLARLVLERSRERARRQVSRIYGTGGAKRHRTIEVAASVVGLPGQMVATGIRRPVYAVKFAENMGDVVWLGADPKWAVHRWESEEAYAMRAVGLWRSRWMPRSTSKLGAFAFLPSTVKFIDGGVSANG